ncbi:NUDIX domain-containing protein [Candidatus Woesearchaeota archaeon]|nr:NUDIX domain-containing protein [Candidatus Woesearchaeota archaeon]
MPAPEISLERAKHNKLFYVVANVVVFRRDDARCLILRRHEREIAHPGKYAVPGGKLEWNALPIERPTRFNGDILDYENAIEELLVRETREEAGIEIDLSGGLKYINSVAFIRPDGIPVVLVKFAAYYKSGNVQLEKGSFTDHAWVNAEEVKVYDCIDGIKQEVAQTISLFDPEK